MPPVKSGIADYSAALAGELQSLVSLEIIQEPPPAFDGSGFDAVLYQVGNNPHHAFVYELAVRHPGIVVLHEANLHHLIADLTINRGDWDAYVAEAEFNGGAGARAYAERVRALEAGPDYVGLPMLRRILERSRALIVHSRAVEEAARTAGFRGPVARIPHGAWIPEADRWSFRDRLGLDAAAPLVGVFGFLKPYKRIPESLRAFRRLLRIEPRAKMILVGEPHPDFPVRSLINSLGLGANVCVLGYAAIEDFVGYMAACDIVLNLRYPTVGETSGSLLRAFGLGKPVLVSDVGAFRDLPGDICLKVPVDASEEQQIFDFLTFLVTRQNLARELGTRAREWVQRECAWPRVAGKYAAFLQTVVEGSKPAPETVQLLEAEPQPASPREKSLAAAVPGAPVPTEAPPQGEPRAFPQPEPLPPPAAAAQPETVLEWAPPDPLFRHYVDTHLSRLTKTLDMIPPGAPGDRILEMGCYLQITPALKSKLGYGEVRGCYYGDGGKAEHRTIVSESGEIFTCDIDLFDAEKDPFPYPNEHFSTVLCCEIIEHLFEDPMHMVAEINRVLRPGGHVLLTTPNIASLRAIGAILQGYHPGLFPQYIKPSHDGTVDPRHNREYSPIEVQNLLEDAGFEMIRLETGPFRDQPTPELAWVTRLLERYDLRSDLRGEGIYALARKTGPVRARYPEWLYA